MRTEQEIIYNILNTIRDAEHNEDERITERLMRSYLSVYRSECLRKYYKNGMTVDDEVFQLVKLKFEKTELTNEFTCVIPKTIRFRENQGFYLEKNGITIPLINSEEYNLYKKNFFGQNLVNAKSQGQRVTLSGGNTTNGFSSGTEISSLITSITNESQKQINQGKRGSVIIDFYGVLQNPDDSPEYNWETDIYPFPSEKEHELRAQILQKEFGVMAVAKRDEIQNSRSDNVRYHENQNIAGGGSANNKRAYNNPYNNTAETN